MLALMPGWIVEKQIRVTTPPTPPRVRIRPLPVHGRGGRATPPVRCDDRLVTGSGDCKLASREGKQQVQLNFLARATGQRGQVPYGTQLNVSKGGSSVSLIYFQGSRPIPVAGDALGQHFLHVRHVVADLPVEHPHGEKIAAVLESQAEALRWLHPARA